MASKKHISPSSSIQYTAARCAPPFSHIRTTPVHPQVLHCTFTSSILTAIASSRVMVFSNQPVSTLEKVALAVASALDNCKLSGPQISQDYHCLLLSGATFPKCGRCFCYGWCLLMLSPALSHARLSSQMWHNHEDEPQHVLHGQCHEMPTTMFEQSPTSIANAYLVHANSIPTTIHAPTNTTNDY